MSIIRTSTRALHRMARDSKSSCRAYTHVSHPVYRVSQQGTRSHTARKSDGWLLPTAAALFGLGFSIFSTHQLVSCKGSSIKAFQVRG